jgi:hypothetical protein
MMEPARKLEQAVREGSSEEQILEALAELVEHAQRIESARSGRRN